MTGLVVAVPSWTTSLCIPRTLLHSILPNAKTAVLCSAVSAAAAGSADAAAVLAMDSATRICSIDCEIQFAKKNAATDAMLKQCE